MQISSCSQSCAIIVTYNPDITALLELSSQLKKESDFIIVDNGTQGIASIVESITVYQKCRAVICLEKNEGLARALNIGILWNTGRRVRKSLCEIVLDYFRVFGGAPPDNILYSCVLI